jgi:hypothetical protein
MAIDGRFRRLRRLAVQRTGLDRVRALLSLEQLARKLVAGSAGAEEPLGVLLGIAGEHVADRLAERAAPLPLASSLPALPPELDGIA